MTRRRWIAVLAAAALGASATPAEAHTLTLARALAKARQYAANIAWAVRAPASGVTGCRRFNPHSVYCQYFIDGLYPEAKPPARCYVPLWVYYLNDNRYVMHVMVPSDPPVDCTSPAGPSPPLPSPPD